MSSGLGVDTRKGVVRGTNKLMSEDDEVPLGWEEVDKFPNNVELADYFVVIPERAKWMGIGMQLIDEYEEET